MPRKKDRPPLVIVPQAADSGPKGSARHGVIVPNFVSGFTRNGQPTREMHGFRILSPLQVYLKRRLIDDREALAGKEYANAWHVAQAALPRTTARYNSLPRPPIGKAPTGFNGSAWPMAEIERLHGRLGDVASRLLMAVALDGIGVSAYAKAAKWRKPGDAMAVLRVALQVSADYFRLPED